MCVSFTNLFTNLFTIVNETRKLYWSSLTSVVSGVPQGTVLGPCLFLIHLMGISSNISRETSASSFVDDTRLQRGIANEEDCERLQEDLDKVYSWADEVGMLGNLSYFVSGWTDSQHLTSSTWPQTVVQ